MPTPEQVTAGQAIYTPSTLRNYDWFVLGFPNRFLWHCPTSELRALSRRNVAARHLDVGVGTGYFLDRVAWPVAQPAITFLDFNPNCLAAAAKRIARYAPTAVQADVFQPLPVPGPFDSVGLCYLLHCLPGTMGEKAAVFDRAASGWLAPISISVRPAGRLRVRPGHKQIGSNVRFVRQCGGVALP